MDIVTLLHTCPLIDINHQDNDGNTALMIAAQAGTSADTSSKHTWSSIIFISTHCFIPGFITILNYILNYFSGVDTEVRDPRGFTALIKAGLQGREDCVSALLMHGEFVAHRSRPCCVYEQINIHSFSPNQATSGDSS